MACFAATVLLGVDGLLGGRRCRASLLRRNDETPVIALAVGPGETIRAVLPDVARLLGDPHFTIERVQICKRNGELVAAPEPLASGTLQKLTVHAGAHARAGQHPLALALVRRLREEGAAGATMLRSIWGYAGSEPPHGERVAFVRQTPTVVVAIDRPAAIERLWPLVDELTAEAGLVTSERVPGFSSAEPGTPPHNLRRQLLRGFVMASGILLLRIVLGTTMAGHGAQKLFGVFGGPGLKGAAGFFGSLRFRSPAALAFGAALTEFGCGTLLALGLLTPLAALGIATVMVTAVGSVHIKKGFWNTNGGLEFNLLIWTAAIAIVATGPLRFSLDHALGWDETGAASGGASASASRASSWAASTWRPVASRKRTS